MRKPTFILTLIVCSQFLCTSLWFAGNAVMPDLILSRGLSESDLGFITSSVQLGFIVGTLFFAVFTLADRYNPSSVFFLSALFGAGFNALIAIDGIGYLPILVLRFLTGFSLAGIYPVGMKIASDYYARGLGRALSFLVGALVLGTSFPHLIHVIAGSLSWKTVIYVTSVLAIVGGFMMYLLVKPGPFRKQGEKQHIGNLFRIFRNENFRAASFGYFGHMWELYAFWAFVPLMLAFYSENRSEFNVPLLSFFIIGSGSIACFIGGLLSDRFGEKKIALILLIASGICCLLSPLFFQAPVYLFITFLIFWGWVVIADSPLLSTLIAYHADSKFRGTALTMVNCLGFSITIISIQITSLLLPLVDFKYLFMLLAIGPFLGVVSLMRPD